MLTKADQAYLAEQRRKEREQDAAKLAEYQRKCAASWEGRDMSAVKVRVV